ncbi:MAG: hypothetical protein MHM6MM_005205 [Cercozoa sp. M6MM]
MSSIGVMNSAYFVGKNELLQFFNTVFSLQIEKVEEVHTGAIPCQVLDAIFPGKVPMRKVDFSARQEYAKLNNWKIFTTVCDQNGVKRKIDPGRLVKGRPMDNLEFAQWLYSLFQELCTTDDYDAVKRRSVCKGGSTFTGGSGRQRPRRTTAAAAATKPRATRVVNTSRMSASNPVAQAPSMRTTASGGAAPRVATSARPRTPVKPRVTRVVASKQDPALQQRVTSLESELKTAREEVTRHKAQYDALFRTAQEIERERNDFYNTLVAVEQLAKAADTNATCDKTQLLRQLFEVLYSDDDKRDAAMETSDAADQTIDETEAINDETTEETTDVAINDDTVITDDTVVEAPHHHTDEDTVVVPMHEMRDESVMDIEPEEELSGDLLDF